MVKKVLTLALGLVLSFGAMAQYGNPTVTENNIRFWTGTGNNRAVIAVTWSDATAGNIGIAWGVQWNGNNVTIGSLMDTIAAYDSRVTLSGSTASFISNIAYQDSELNLIGPDNWWWYNWKAADGSEHTSAGVGSDIAVNGDFIDWLPMDEETYESPIADRIIMATDPNAPQAVEATIDANEILYWVGEGSNKAVMAVNWANTALAWGYKFDGTKTVSDMMAAIAAADPRFSYTMDGSYLNDILFVVAPGDTLRRQAYGWWESQNNSMTDMGMSQTLNNGDFEKWAEPDAGVAVYGSNYGGVLYYTYLYPMEIQPVSVPQGSGIYGVEGISLNVYPNPASNMVVLSGFEGNGQAYLYDMRGSVVSTYALSGNETRLDLSAIPSGIYLLRVAGSAVKIVKK
ncbi:MAG: T9SS type A sorting domain-containing protein [bacterium]